MERCQGSGRRLARRVTRRLARPLGQSDRSVGPPLEFWSHAFRHTGALPPLPALTTSAGLNELNSPLFLPCSRPKQAGEDSDSTDLEFQGMIASRYRFSRTDGLVVLGSGFNLRWRIREVYGEAGSDCGRRG